MLSPDVLNIIITKYETEQNFTRLVYYVIDGWESAIDEDLLIYWVIKCYSLSKECKSTLSLDIGKEIVEKGFALGNILKILIQKKAIRQYKKEGITYYCKNKFK